MGRIGRKDGACWFILFISRWTRIKDLKKIEKRVNGTPFSISANAQLFDSNWSKALSKTSLLRQVFNTKDKLSDVESMARLEANFEYKKKADLFCGILASDANQDQKEQKKELQTFQTNATKQSKLPNKIFDYIYVARYQKLFPLAWYDDMTYAQSENSSSIKVLPVTCCNGPNCNFIEPYYTQ